MENKSAEASTWGQPVSPPASQTETGGWGQPAPQAPSAWGEPNANPAAPAQPPAGEGAADAADEDRRSSLASAAGGALISPVRGRRKKEAPAFDWGQSDSSDNAGGAAAGSDEDENVKKLGDTLRGLFNK